MTSAPAIRRAQIRNVIVSFCMLIALAVAQPFLWNFVRASATALHNERTEEEQYTNLKIRVEETSKQNNSLAEELKEVGVSFPSTNSVAQLVERIEGQARDVGIEVTIKTINEGQVASLNRKGDTGIIPLSITVEAFGTPGQLLEYLQSLEHTPEVTTIDSWSLNPQGTSGRHSLLMNVVFYLQPQNNG